MSPLWICLSQQEREALETLRWWAATGNASIDTDKLIAASEKINAVVKKYEACLDERFIETARQFHFIREGEIEIDDHAVVSPSEDGAYVMAWVWVDRTAVEPDYVPSYDRD